MILVFEFSDADNNDDSQNISEDKNAPANERTVVSIMMTQRLRRFFEDKHEYLTEDGTPDCCLVVVERGLAKPSARIPKPWWIKPASVPAVISEKAAKQKNRLSTRYYSVLYQYFHQYMVK